MPTVRDYPYGYAWSPPDGVLPAVIAVGLGRFESAGITRQWRCQNPNWVIDCPLVAGMRTRTRSTRQPWRTRLAGELFLLPPEMPYWEQCPADLVVHSVFIVFRGGERTGLADMVDPQSGRARIHDPDGRVWRRLEEAVDASRVPGDNGFWRAQACLAEAIATLLVAHREDPGVYRLDATADAPDAETAFVRSVDACMQRHLSGGLTLRTLAESQNMSVSTFCRRFRAAAHEPPMARYLALRLATARALLTKGEPLKAIAYRTGFSDAFHFSRAFKQAFGQSPSAFRETHGANP
jgi:AraC-like DNA-binding protein